MAEHDGAQHDVFRQFLRFRFHHQHRLLGTGHDQIKLGRFQFGRGGIQDILTADVTDTRRADGAVKRNAGEGKRGGRADHGGDVGIDLVVRGDNGCDQLNFVVEAVGKQGTDGAIDKPRGQDFLLGGAAFTPEEPARDLPRRVRPLLVVHGQRKKILSFRCLPGSDHGDQHDGVFHVDQHCARRLARDFAGLEDQPMPSPDQ